MDELLALLQPGSRILDLGAGSGSFRASRHHVCVIHLDLQTPRGCVERCVVGDAAQLPFPSHCFDAIVSSHSLEHFTQLEESVREIGRVIKPGGLFYAAVPDSSTLTDRIYRWLARGGGHVNGFRSPEAVIGVVEGLAGLKHSGTNVLFSSLSFLNSRNFVAPPPKRIALFAFGNESCLMVFTWILRLIDRLLGTRLSVYGWCFYFGDIECPLGTKNQRNVCVRCGSGHAEAFLKKCGAIKRVLGFLRSYRCPVCGATNFLTGDIESPQLLR
jgi:hypothetical protein